MNNDNPQPNQDENKQEEQAPQTQTIEEIIRQARERDLFDTTPGRDQRGTDFNRRNERQQPPHDSDSDSSVDLELDYEEELVEQLMRNYRRYVSKGESKHPGGPGGGPGRGPGGGPGRGPGGGVVNVSYTLRF